VEGCGKNKALLIFDVKHPLQSVWVPTCRNARQVGQPIWPWCVEKRFRGLGLRSPVAVEDVVPYNCGNLLLMDCPFCRHAIAATWQLFVANTNNLGLPVHQFQAQLHSTVSRGDARNSVSVTTHWLQCQNCQEIVIQITRSEANQSPPTETWIALPKRQAIPLLHPLVTDPFRKDYLEAWTILEDSPRMSAVLSRRLLADLLEKYASLSQFSLAQRIDGFIKDARHPLWIRQNLHYLREVGDFGAHTQQDKTAAASATTQTSADPVIINVDKPEAEWTLKIIDDLFEYFIVAPQKDKDMRTAIDKKLADASRKAITPLTS
jgi:hypothetical protein